MGFAYLGIGVGGAIVPLLAHALTQRFGWQAALQILGVLMIVIAFPMAWFVREKPEEIATAGANQQPSTVNCAAIVNRQSSIVNSGALPSLAPVLKSPAFYLLMVGSMCSIGAVGGTMQNLKLFLSLDVKLAQGEVAQIASLVLVGSLDRPHHHGLSRRSVREEVRDAAHLLHRRVRDPAAVSRRHAGGAVRLRAAVRHRPGRRLHDHPADGGRAVRRADAGAADGDRADGRRHRRSDRADAGGRHPRCHRQLRERVCGAHRAGGPGRRGGGAAAEATARRNRLSLSAWRARRFADSGPRIWHPLATRNCSMCSSASSI